MENGGEASHCGLPQGKDRMKGSHAIGTGWSEKGEDRLDLDAEQE